MFLNNISVNTPPTTTNVLLKDDSNTLFLGLGTAKALVQLESSRMDWEQGAYRTSNQALYTLLADCLAFCGELPLSEAKQRSVALEAFYKARNYNYKQDLPLATRVVRAVFGSKDRRRISTYSIVIRQALKQRVSVTDFADWVEKNGGVQEISISKSANYVSPKTKAEIAKNNLQDKSPIGFAKSELLSHLADADKLGDMCVLLADQQADGSFGIYAVLRQDGLVKAAFTSMYSLGQEILAKAQAEVNAANDADSTVAKSA